MLRRIPAVLICVLGLFGPGPRAASASVGNQVPLGPRAIGLGGAYTSVADDISGIFWNPAGLVEAGHQEIAAYHAGLYGSGLEDNYAAFLIPLSARLALAGDWYHSGLQEQGLGFSENRFDLAVSTRLSPLLAVGLAGKFLTRSIEYDGLSVRDGRGLGLDAGLILSPARRLRLGLLLQDIFDTRLTYSEGNGSAEAYGRNLRLGASFAPWTGTLLALDVDDRVHAGLEVQPADPLFLRAGLQKDRTVDDGVVWAVGGTVELGAIRFDYAREMHPALGSSNHLGLTLAFNFNPAQIRVEEVKAAPLYASLYKSYAERPFATVVIRNLKDEQLRLQLGVFVPGYMDQPSEHEIFLRPRATQEFPLTAVFTEKAMEQDEDGQVQLELSATYQSARLPRTERKSAPAASYGRGAINWSAGVDQAAAFVTARDPLVVALARDPLVTSLASAASSEAGSTDSTRLGSPNIAFTAAIFSALEEVGISYVPDPYSPYAAVAQTEYSVDTIHYPRETLLSGGGDCDDTTVLLAALLANVGIDTRFVDTPEHIFLLVDSGVHERNRLKLSLDEEYYVVLDETIWIPVETTALGDGFTEAWASGAAQYRTWSERSRLTTVDVGSAQARYQPAIPPGPDTPPGWSLTGLSRRFAGQVSTIETWRREFREEIRREPESASASALNELALVYFQAGSWDHAEDQLRRLAQVTPGSAAAANNSALVLLARGRVPEAVALLRSAASLDPADPGIRMNLALAGLAAGDPALAREGLAAGLDRLDDFAAALALLKLSGDADPGDDPVARLLALLTATLGDNPSTSPDGKAPRLEHVYWKPVR